MKTYYIKVITGFRQDQEVSIPMQEAHKAYYLFTHPEERGVFDNGVALVGKNISEIKPDWNKTMGWNDDHKLDSDDLNQIRGMGVESKMRLLIEKAKDAGKLMEVDTTLANKKLAEVLPLLG